MAKKIKGGSTPCPNGTLCIGTGTAIFLTIVVIVVGVWYYQTRVVSNKEITITETKNVNPVPIVVPRPEVPMILPAGNCMGPWGCGDVLRNEYAPPVRPIRYPAMPPMLVGSGAAMGDFYQVGILTPVDGGPVHPLMGRPRSVSRDKWQYYTINSGYQGIKLPLIINGKNGMSEYGVNELMNEDVVVTEGTHKKMRVTVYQNDTIRYMNM